MFGNNGSRIASWLISFMPTSRWHGLKRFLLRKIGGIQIGDRTSVFSGAKFIGRYIKIGSDCHIGTGCYIAGLSPDAGITIGDWCSLGPEVFMTTGGHDISISPDHNKNGIGLPIVVGKHCGLSVRCMIMAGVTIGDYCVISPGVVVSKDVPDKSILAQPPPRRLSF